MNIAQLRHRVHLCSQHDVVIDGTLKLNREGVLSMWASIEAKASNAFSPNGAAFREKKDQRTHVIVTRYHRDLDISIMAWIYEARLKSAPRWFRVIRSDVTEGKGSQFFKFDCVLIESKADIPEPSAERPVDKIAMPLPEGIKL